MAIIFDLEVVDVDHINTHGGSLRVWLAHNGCVQPSQSVHDQLQTEHAAGIESIEIFEDFSSSVQLIKNNLLKFLLKFVILVKLYMVMVLQLKVTRC